jgi:acetylornithine deacetylase/succinyl-diaminopimelate desuccinylase-like protein
LNDISAVDRIIARRLASSLADLARLCAQPSVSASGQGIAECAALVGEMLSARGFSIRTIATAGHQGIWKKCFCA